MTKEITVFEWLVLPSAVSNTDILIGRFFMFTSPEHYSIQCLKTFLFVLVLFSTRI